MGSLILFVQQQQQQHDESAQPPLVPSEVEATQSGAGGLRWHANVRLGVDSPVTCLEWHEVRASRIPPLITFLACLARCSFSLTLFFLVLSSLFSRSHVSSFFSFPQAHRHAYVGMESGTIRVYFINKSFTKMAYRYGIEAHGASVSAMQVGTSVGGQNECSLFCCIWFCCLQPAAACLFPPLFVGAFLCIWLACAKCSLVCFVHVMCVCA